MERRRFVTYLRNDPRIFTSSNTPPILGPPLPLTVIAPRPHTKRHVTTDVSSTLPSSTSTSTSTLFTLQVHIKYAIANVIKD